MKERFIEFNNAIKTYDVLCNNLLVIKIKDVPFNFKWVDMNIKYCKCLIEIEMYDKRDKRFVMKQHLLDTGQIALMIMLDVIPESKRIFESIMSFQNNKNVKFEYEKMELLTSHKIHNFEILIDNFDDYIELINNHILNNLY